MYVESQQAKKLKLVPLIDYICYLAHYFNLRSKLQHTNYYFKAE